MCVCDFKDRYSWSIKVSIPDIMLSREFISCSEIPLATEPALNDVEFSWGQPVKGVSMWAASCSVFEDQGHTVLNENF